MEILLAAAFLWVFLCISLYATRRHRTVKPVPPDTEIRDEEVTYSPRRFLQRLFLMAFCVRFVLVLLFAMTGAIKSLRLSPDSLRYHREGVEIARQMQQGFFNWPNWIDNGWFQFTGLVYYLFGTQPIIVQTINAFLGALTPIVVYHLVKRVYGIEKVARWTAILTAFFPSFIYWSCLMLKDPLSIFAMALLVLAVVALRETFSLKWLAAGGFSLLTFLAVREYMFFVAIFFIAMSYFPVEGRRTGLLIVKMLIIVLLVGGAAYAMGFGFMGIDYIQQSHYFDLDYINQSRVKIGDHGSGAFFDDPTSALWGKDFPSTLKAMAAAVYFFFVTLDLANIDSARQLMALPEVLIVVLLLPAMFRGMLYSWRNLRQRSLPLMIFSLGILAVYGSATTNMGAMFRWRMQAMPFLLAFIVFGLTLVRRGWMYRLLSRLRI